MKEQSELYICVNSDGSALDTLKMKHLEIFEPEFVKVFNIQEYREDLLEFWTKINLYSEKRGGNRYVFLLDALEFLEEIDVKVEGIDDYRQFLDSGNKLTLEAVEKAESTCHKEIFLKAVEWSHNINEIIYNLPPEKIEVFNNAVKALEKIKEKANIIVFSLAPVDLVESEWKKAGLENLPDEYYGQEFGNKSEIVAHLLEKYNIPKEKMLIIGDTAQDVKAAEENGCYFHPIMVDDEENCWKDIEETSFEAFAKGEYAPIHEEMTEKFKTYLNIRQ